MNEPRRFLQDDEPKAASDLLRSAMDDSLDEDVRKRIALAIGLGPISAETAPGAPGAKPARVGVWRGGLFGKLVVGLAILGGVVGLSMLAVHSGQPRTSIPVHALPTTTSLADPGAIPQPADTAALSTAPSQSPDPPVPTASSAASSTLARAHAAPSATGRSLAEEVASLDRARTALAAGGPAAALSELNRHEKEFPRGALAVEAMVLRIEALSRSNRAAAVSLASGFLKAHPQSPYSARIRSLVPEVGE
jgi:hypothetical protein